MNIIDTIPGRVREKILCGALPPVQHLLPAVKIECWCAALGYRWRERRWGPVITLLACIWKQAQTVASCRQVEDWAASLADEDTAGHRDGHDFCAARARLPLEVFIRSLWHLASAASQQGAWTFGGWRVWLVDGTTFRASRSPANLKGLGQVHHGQKASCLPVARMVARICGGSGAVLDTVLGAYRVSEMDLIRVLLERLEAGGLLVLDRGFASFMVLWLAQQRGCHALTHHHQTRRGKCARRLGPGDEIQFWPRPQALRITWPDLLPQTPEQLEVRVVQRIVHRRGYRDWKLKLSTTLLDPVRYPADELVMLYLQRWNIEVDFRTLKTHYGVSRLTGQTPEIVAKEILSALIAHNVVRTLLAQTGTQTRTLSPTRALRLLLCFSERMAAAPTLQLPRLYRRLLALMAQTQFEFQERRPQPRQLIWRRRDYPILKASRKQWWRKYIAA